MDRSVIEKIAQLSRLELSEEEKEFYEKHLSLVLGHFKALEEVNTVGVEPLVSPLSGGSLRDKDETVSFSNKEDILSESPERSGNLFKVPPVVG